MNEFLDFVAEIFEDDIKNISLKTEYEKYAKWDSMAHLRLIMEIEEKYDIEIPINQVIEIKTLEQLYNLIKEKN